MNPLMLLPLLTRLVQSTPSGATDSTESAETQALLKALLAAAAQPSQTPPTEPQQKGSGLVEAVIITAFVVAMLGASALAVYSGAASTALVILAFGMGALVFAFATSTNFRFGSSWGSRIKDLRPAGGTVVVPPIVPPVLPPAQPPEPLPAVPSRPTIQGVGRSTDPSTATKRMDVPKELGPASIRYNNPGAQWPSAEAAKFGQIGYGQLRDGQGNKIARFPHPVNGAASNFDLLSRKYVGMTYGAAGKKWTGSNGFGIPGYPDSTVLTAAIVNDPTTAIPILKAIAEREAGKDSPLTEDEWKAAHAMFLAGSADAYLDGETGIPSSKQPTGADIVALVRPKIGQKYVFGAKAPKNGAGYNGPWDCAELASWAVYQAAGLIYGCTNDSDDPAQADAYTGAWQRDANSIGRMVSVSEATGTPGAFLLRYPASGATGHIVVSDGQGGTIEAASTTLGVIAGKVSGRRWDTGVLPPGIDYTRALVSVRGPTKIYAVGQPNMDAAKIKEIQTALVAKGFGPLEIDGDYGPATAAAAAAFQRAQGNLIADGEVGELTAAPLGVTL